MSKQTHGGAREGAGRPATGVKTKCYTVTLPIDEAEVLEKNASICGETVNRYLRDMIREGVKYTDLQRLPDLYPDDMPEYRVEKKVKKERKENEKKS